MLLLGLFKDLLDTTEKKLKNALMITMQDIHRNLERLRVFNNRDIEQKIYNKNAIK
jgi:hypothetical protein